MNSSLGIRTLATLHKYCFQEFLINMPSRKKSNLSSLSSKKRRAKLAQKSESQTQRERRLKEQCVRQANNRAAESNSQRVKRKVLDAESHAHARKIESQETQQQRLVLNSERLAHARETESEEARQQRLVRNSERLAHARETESEEARQQRLILDSERHAHAREMESEEARQQRLFLDSERHAHERETESQEARQQRLSLDSERHTLSRSLESAVQHDIRVNTQRKRQIRALAAENESQYVERLAAIRRRYDNIRQNELQNVVVNQQRVQLLRGTESTAEYEERLTQQRERDILNRELELNNSDMVALRWVQKNNSGFSYVPEIDYEQESNIGPMDTVCTFCQALKWRKESKGLCCSSGKVRLELIQEPPEPLKSLLTGQHEFSKHFLGKIRCYNSAFQMTSFGAKEIKEGNFMPTFKILGQVYHRIGSLLPVENEKSKFLQIYFISDYEDQVNTRLSHTGITNLNRNLITNLQNMLQAHNSYVRDFKAALQSLPTGNEDNFKLVINADRRPASAHSGRYNAPSTNEVAVLMVNQECGSRDIVLRTRDNQLQRIAETHRSYDALQYPLLFCRGEDGYNFQIFNYSETDNENTQKKTSALQFYCYRVMFRQHQYNHLHYFRQLLNQYLVDMYAKIETERLMFIKMNQKKLRSENYVHLQDALREDGNTENLGQLVILPSTFTGSPRYMHERTQDAFCYVRKYGRPDLFLTMTTNPKWNEIKK